jgi:MFS family permease
MSTQDVAGAGEAAAAEQAPPGQGGYVSAAYRNYALILLMAIYMVNLLDRQVVNILAEPIKRDLHLADWQLGLMSGFAFALFYSFLGIPIARLAERGNRPLIIGVAAAVWSAFTVVCGTVQTFWHLVLARIGVGVGEAGCTPPAHSLIFDYAPPEKRSSSLAVYGMGGPLGGLLGMAFGGLVADAYGWRAAFFLAGAPGIVFAVLAIFTLKEPRRQLAKAMAERPPQTSFRETLQLLRSKTSFWFVIVGQALKAFIQYGKGPFVASFFLRSHSDGVAAAAESFNSLTGLNLGSTGFLGVSLGLLAGLGGALGIFTGGKLTDHFGLKDARNYLRIPALAILLTVPLFIGVVTSPTVAFALGFVGLHAYAVGVSYAGTYAVALGVAPAHMRATTSALIMFAGNLIGLGMGPLFVGLCSDLFAVRLGDAEGLRQALIFAAAIGVVPAALFLGGVRTVRRDLEG